MRQTAVFVKQKTAHDMCLRELKVASQRNKKTRKIAEYLISREGAYCSTMATSPMEKWS